MESVTTIYNRYRIMPTLQNHQLRVAAVAAIICDSIPSVDRDTVVTTCLYHDMGNIIKFDLSYFPDFVQPEGLDYWTAVQREYIEQYGTDEHVATQMIASEIGLSETMRNYIDTIGFSKVAACVADESLERKICCYADQRVGPHGLLSITERLHEGRKRYANRTDKVISTEKFEVLAAALQELEHQIFQTSTITPAAITDEMVQQKVETFLQ